MPAQHKFTDNDFIDLSVSPFFAKNHTKAVTDCEHINVNMDADCNFLMPNTDEYFDPRTLVQPEGIDLTRMVLFVDDKQTNKYEELLECKYEYSSMEGVRHVKFQPLPASSDPMLHQVKLHLAFADLNSETIDKEWLLTISNIAKLLGAPSNTSYPLEHSNWMKNFITKPMSMTRFFFRMATMYLGTMMANADLVQFTPRHSNVFALISTPTEHQSLIDSVRKGGNDVFWLPSGFSHKRSALSVLALLAAPTSSFTGLVGTLWPEMNSPIVAYCSKDAHHQDIENDNVTAGMIYSVISTLIAYYDAKDYFIEMLNTVAMLAIRPADGKGYCFGTMGSVLSLPNSDMRAQVLGPIISGGPDAFIDYQSEFDYRSLLIRAAYRRAFLSPCMALAVESTGAHLYSLTESQSHEFKAQTSLLQYNKGTVLLQTTVQVAAELGHPYILGRGLKYWEPLHSTKDGNILSALTNWSRYHSWQLATTMGFKTPLYGAGHSFVTPLAVENPTKVSRVWGKMDFVTKHRCTGYITSQLPGTQLAYWTADRHGFKMKHISTSSYDNHSYSPSYPMDITQVGKSSHLVVLPTTMDVLLYFNQVAVHKRSSTVMIMARDNYNCMNSAILDGPVPTCDLPSTLVESIDKDNFIKDPSHQMQHSYTDTGPVNFKMSVIQDILRESKLLDDPQVKEYVDAYCSGTWSNRDKIDKEWPIYHQLVKRMPELLQKLPFHEREEEFKRFLITSKSLAISCAHLDKAVVAKDCDFMFTIEKALKTNPGMTFEEVMKYAKEQGSLIGSTTFANVPKKEEINDILASGKSIVEWLLYNNQAAKLGAPTSKKNAVKQEEHMKKKKESASARLRERLVKMKTDEEKRNDIERKILSQTSSPDAKGKGKMKEPEFIPPTDPDKSDFRLATGVPESLSEISDVSAAPPTVPGTSMRIIEDMGTEE